MKPLRAGVVGLGTMGRNHARVLATMPGVRLVGATDPNPAARLTAPAITVTEHLDELLSLGIDMCVVAVPTLDHVDVGLRLAGARVHTLIEKPLAASVRDGDRLAAAFDSAGVVGCVGHIERFNPVLRAARSRVQHGDLGRLFQITTSRQGPYPYRIRDVGVVLDLASHDIDLTRWLAGAPYLKVAAFTTRSMTRKHEDLAAVAGLLSDGTVVSHLVNWLSPLKERLVTVTGERGCLRADLLRTELWFQRGGPASADGPTGEAASEGLTPCQVNRREPLRAELENFRDAVLGRSADIVSMRQATEVLEVASAVLATVPTLRREVPAAPPDVLAGHAEITAIPHITLALDGSKSASPPRDAGGKVLIPQTGHWLGQ